MWPDNRSFSPKLPALQLHWDSVSLGALKKCPRYYELAIVRGWRGRGQAIDLEFGIFLHSACEVYDKRKAAGCSHEEAALAALDWLMTATWDAKLDRPWSTENAQKNRFTLVRTVVWYLEQWRDDPLATVVQADGSAAVEVSFSFELDFGPVGPEHSYDAMSDEHPPRYALCGHLDRIGRFNERLWIADKKTTRHALDARYFSQFSPDNQVSLYTLAGQIVLGEQCAGVVIEGIQVGVGFSRCMRGNVQRTSAQLEEWLHSLRVLLDQAEGYARANFWPQNERSCGWIAADGVPRQCEFRSICAKSPSVRERWLEADFTRRVWDPTEKR